MRVRGLVVMMVVTVMMVMPAEVMVMVPAVAPVVMVPAVVPVVMVPAVAGAIRAGFRLERADFERHRQTELAHHAIQDVIMLVREAAELHLKRDVTVAEVVRGAEQREEVVAVHHRELFGRGAHHGDGAVLRAQPIALLERGAAREEHPAITAGVEASGEAAPRAEIPRHRE
jgi:hypothetical protein